MKILGIEVPDSLRHAWRSWLAPAEQPFFVRATSARRSGRALPPELRDTFHGWKISKDARVRWLTEDAFAELSRPARAALVREQVVIGRGSVPTVRAWAAVLDATVLRQQADGHRFVWWPSVLAPRADDVLARIVTEGLLPSRHSEVSARTWRRCSRVLPAARAIAGTFPDGSGPNCFGTVMAAAGVRDVRSTPPLAVATGSIWTKQAPFVSWLEENARRGGSDDEAGTVLVWRDAGGIERHAAVTIGDGWGLEKPSQSWATPRAILRVRDIIRTNRTPGMRLERHTLQPSSP